MVEISYVKLGTMQLGIGSATKKIYQLRVIATRNSFFQEGSFFATRLIVANKITPAIIPANPSSNDSHLSQDFPCNFQMPATFSFPRQWETTEG